MKSLGHHFLCIPGWRTNRKIVVLQSDDWGSVRMSSRKAYEHLLKKAIPVDRDPYCKYDAIATEDDLIALFETLKKFKDKNGRHPVITANTIVANPNFDKIKSCNFQEYYYEPFPETLKKYSRMHENSFAIWQQGIREQLFEPHFHGREHLNVDLWLRELRHGNKAVLTAFEEGVFGIPIPNSSLKRGNLMAAFDCISYEHNERIKKIAIDGIDLFFKIFKYRSPSLMAPCYIWRTELESTTFGHGIKGIQGIFNQFEPNVDKANYTRKFHFTGERNEQNQIYLVRNSFFEPSHFPSHDNVGMVLNRMKIAFLWRKPVIMSSHRLNYIGSIDEQNRTNNLKSLTNLLSRILKTWPNVEFMSTADLLTEITEC